MHNTKKKTKIVCTIGPTSNSEEMITRLIASGMDIARMNFSHSTHEQHKKIFETLRFCEQKSGRAIGILADLQGPKIRTGKLKDGPFELKTGDTIWINDQADFPGTPEEIGCTYKNIILDLEENHKVLIDDGKLTLQVRSKTAEKAELEVIVGGLLKDNKGINLPGTPVTAPALSEKDIEDLKFAMGLGVDFVALSFVRRASDLELARQILKSTFIGLIAKIERPEAVANIDEIIAASDGIMIARGDMGVELETERVPIIQKQLIRKMNEEGKPVITATQMLESMIENPTPTRAEASDVANAVLDGTDAVMLSGESASGKYPIESVTIMNKIIQEAESVFKPIEAEHQTKQVHKEEEIALGTAAKQIAESIGAKAIINFTRSGYSANLASRFRPSVPIYSFTPFLLTARKMNLMRGVYPLVLPMMDKFNDMINFMNQAIQENKTSLQVGDTVVILAGAPGGEAYTVDFLQLYHLK
ncbi:MAG: pyruvate kinase [Spirochaetota bacterium]